MPKSDLPFGPGEYAPVAARIALFYAVHPTGRIITALVSRSPSEITFRASVYRDELEERPAATGWASERPGDGDVNAVACLENTETSAVGRALANLGFTASYERPSLEEMEKADRMRRRSIERSSRLRHQDRPRAGTDASIRPVDAAATSRTLHNLANALHDVLGILEEAEHLGFSAGRAGRLRGRLLDPGVQPALVDRIERAVRGWLVRRRRHVGSIARHRSRVDLNRASQTGGATMSHPGSYG